MSGYPGCDVPPLSIAEEGQLYLGLPLAHTRAKLCGALDQTGIEYRIHNEELVSLTIEAGVFSRFVEAAAGKLSSVELQDARSLLLPLGAEPAAADLVRMESLASLIARIEGRWLADLLAEERLITYFQPIVDCRDGEHVFAYECLSRGIQRSGDLIYPGRLYSAARSTSMMYHLDRAARLRAIGTAAEYRLQTKVFINFNPASIYDPAFCLRSTVQAIEESRLARNQFVFEVVESARALDERHLQGILEYFRSSGLQVALDDVGSGYRSLNMLSKLKPDFIKLDVDLIHDADSDPYKAQSAARLMELARGLGVQTIAEGVETEAEWQWLREHGADYVQGYYFARPSREPGRPLLMAAVD